MLLKNVVSIDIGSSLIKMVQLSQSSGKIRLEKVGVIDNPTSNLRTLGYKLRKNTIAQAIKHSLKKTKIKARDAISSLGGSSIIIQYFKFPPLSGKELADAVCLEAQRVMGSKLNGMETDFQVLAQNQKKAEEEETLFVAVPKEMIQQRMETLQQSGLNPVAIDIDCLALANCFLRLKNLTSQKRVMVLNLGTRLISLGILGKDNLDLVRDINLDSKTPLDFREESTLEKVVGEVRRSIHYHESRARREKVTRVFLTGGGAVASETAELFLKALEIPGERWNPIEDLEFNPRKLGNEFKKSHGYLLAIAIGLALREK